MQMQEPEQRQQSAQESLAYGTGYTGSYVSEDQPEESEIGIGNSYQGQKLHPGAMLNARGKTFSIITIILSSLLLGLTIVGIVASALVLKNADGQQQLLAAGIMGLVSSIVALLACVTIFVLAIVDLAIRTGNVGRRSIRMRRGRRYY